MQSQWPMPIVLKNINSELTQEVSAEQRAILSRLTIPFSGQIKKIKFNISNLFNEVKTAIDPNWHILDRITDSIYLSQIPDKHRQRVIDNTLTNDTLDKQGAGKVIVSVTDYFEQAETLMIRPHEWNWQAYHHYQLPMNDFSANISMYELIAVTDYMHAQINTGNVINVHCKAGRARCALVVSVYLARFGLLDEYHEYLGKVNQQTDKVADNLSDQEIKHDSEDSEILSRSRLSYKFSVVEYLNAKDKLLPNPSDQEIQQCYEILSPIEKIIIAAKHVAAQRKQVNLHYEKIEQVYESVDCDLSNDKLSFILETDELKQCTKLKKAILAIAVCDYLQEKLNDDMISNNIVENAKIVQNLQQDKLFQLKLAFTQTFEFKEYLFTFFNKRSNKNSIITFGQQIIEADTEENLREVIADNSKHPELLEGFNTLLQNMNVSHDHRNYFT